MNVQLKQLSEQVVLITGASSGIGRQSAVRFAAEGAKVILVARNSEALREVVGEIEGSGGKAMYFAADVANVEQFKAAAEAGVQRFGRIDTWINNAGVGLYSRLLTTDIADDRRLFETNFWGMVNGSRLAVPYLQGAGGGALINVGSEVSDISIPIQGMYSTSKHAVMGFTDALRQEIIEADMPVSVTLIKPAAINTPFARHAKNNLEQDATLPAPVYDVDLAADQILHAARYGGRELYVGGGGLLMVLFNQHFPRLGDWLNAKIFGKQQLADRPADHSFESLHESRGFHRASGDVDRDRHIQKMSFYGIARRNPLKMALLVTAGVAAAALAAHAVHEERN